MRVLHAISGIRRSQGGPTFALEGLAAAQRRIGLDVTVIATYIVDEGREAATNFDAIGVACHVYGPAHGKLSRLRGLNEIVARHVRAHDVVHIHAMWEEIQHVAAVEARRAGKPYVWRACNAISWPIMHKSYWPKRAMLAWRLKRDLNRAAAMHYTTENERDESAWLGLRSPTIVEPNGVEVSPTLVGSRRAFVERYPQLIGRRVLLFVGRLNPEKGFDLLIPAFAQARADDWTLVIAGSDPDRPYRHVVETMVRDSGVADHVLLTGHLDGQAKLDAYAAADLFVLPSRSENFGNVVLEALAAGVPVVVTRGVGLAGEVRAAGVGVVVEHTAASLAGGLRQLMSDETGRHAIATRAPAVVAERFGWDTIARRWAGHYGRLVGAAVR